DLPRHCFRDASHRVRRRLARTGPARPLLAHARPRHGPGRGVRAARADPGRHAGQGGVGDSRLAPTTTHFRSANGRTTLSISASGVPAGTFGNSSHSSASSTLAPGSSLVTGPSDSTSSMSAFVKVSKLTPPSGYGLPFWKAKRFTKSVPPLR